MTKDTDVAIARNDIEHIKESLGTLTEIATATRDQALKTNGRVTKLEVRHEEEDKQDFWGIVRDIQKFKIQALAILTIVPIIMTTGGWMILKYSMDSYHDGRDVITEEKILTAVDKKLEKYVFEEVESTID